MHKPLTVSLNRDVDSAYQLHSVTVSNHSVCYQLILIYSVVDTSDMDLENWWYCSLRFLVVMVDVADLHSVEEKYSVVGMSFVVRVKVMTPNAYLGVVMVVASFHDVLVVEALVSSVMVDD
jgi:hypothetical protein